MGRPAGVKNKQVEAARQNEVLSAVKDLSLEKVSNKIAATQVEVQNQLAILSTKVTEQLGMLNTVEQAIQVKRDELKQLYGIETTATTLDELNAELEAKRLSWQDEQKKLEQNALEADQNRRTKWARDEEQYQYKLSQEHQKILDEANKKIGQITVENRNKQELLEKTWALREEALKTKETEFAQLKEQVINFPKVLDAEITKATNSVSKTLKSQYDTDMRIRDAEAAGNQKLSIQTIAALEGTIKDLNGQIAALKIQLEKAHNDMKEISKEALSASSSRETVANLQKAFESVQGSKGSK